MTENYQDQEYRIPPQALDFERTVIGSMIYDNRCIPVVIDMLVEDCFYMSAHKIIFSAISKMFARNVPVDVTLLTEHIRKNGQLEDVGEECYIAEIVESNASLNNVPYYCNTLLDKYRERKRLFAAGEITNVVFSDKSTEEKIEEIDDIFFRASEEHRQTSLSGPEENVPKFFDDLEMYAKGTKAGLGTGFEKLDEILCGLEPGNLIIIAGRSSMGKTSFALDLTMNIAAYKKTVCLFSLEVTKEELVQKMICSKASVSMHAMKRGMLSKRDLPQLNEAAASFHKYPIFIDDTPAISPMKLQSTARLCKMKNGLDLIVVDYLQLMGSSSKTENRQQEISKISRSLKGVAKYLGVPVIALSQLSREVDKRKSGNHRPVLADLRESGAIEQDADIVLFVYRDEYYNKDDESVRGKAEIIVGKQRNGPLGTAELAFVNQFAKFGNISTGSFDDE